MKHPSQKQGLPSGISRATWRFMKKPIRRHEDLIAWQLCSQLRRLVLRYIRNGPAANDFDYRYQLRKAARSACYNTSEGFYRYRHGQFGNHLDIARSSLGEALDQLDEGLENEYFTNEQHLEMRRLCLRAVKANSALKRSWTGEAPGVEPLRPRRKHPGAPGHPAGPSTPMHVEAP